MYRLSADHPTPEPIADTTVQAAGRALHALTAGRGLPVVLLHGASGNARDFTFGTIQTLARRHAVIAFDRPGLGRSEAPAAGIESPFFQAELMAEALAAMGHGAPILVGHSYGGSVALAWALARPERVRGVVLLGAPTQVWEGGVGMTNDLLARPLFGPALATAASRLVTRGFVDTAARRVFAPQPVPDDYIDRLGRERVLLPATLQLNARQLTALKENIRAMVPGYPSLPMPISILHGDLDGIVPMAVHAQPFAAQAPFAELAVLRGIGHMPHHALPERVLAAVDAVDARA